MTALHPFNCCFRCVNNVKRFPTKINITVRAFTVYFLNLLITYTNPLVYKIFSCHLYLHITHAGLPLLYFNQTYLFISSGLLNILLVNTGFFFFDIFRPSVFSSIWLLVCYILPLLQQLYILFFVPLGCLVLIHIPLMIF